MTQLDRRAFLGVLLGCGIGSISVPAVAGEGVYRAQLALQRLGYNPGPADGLYGRQTQRAIRRFQRNNGLAITGRLNSATIDELYRDTRRRRRRR